jgi:hypothetical protein
VNSKIYPRLKFAIHVLALRTFSHAALGLLQTAGRARASQLAIMNTSQPVSSAISGVEFGFMTTDDVRTLSVKRITNPTTFDSLLHPVPGGLHDAALGAFLDNP